MSRKQWLMVKLMLLSFIFIMLCFISMTVMNPSRPGDPKFRFNKANSMPSETGEKKAFSAVDKIVIDAISLPVEIYESDVAEVTLQDNSQIYGLGKGKPNKIFYNDGTLGFEQSKKISFLSHVRGNIIIEVPRGSVLEYDLGNVSGNINHNAVSRGTLRAETISGSIKIYQRGEKVSAESVSGSVRIYAPYEEARGESVSGSISLIANQDSKEVSGFSVSGSIKIQLEKVLGYEMDYSTTSGSVKDTYSNIDYSKSGKSENGDSSLKINAVSVSGSIKLTDWE
ncbi:MAG TPA: DUF4097 domain-containing protein [Epulopiscium sp.]|nr:DUF4097 domain-containing protein [Candidatus Epulonipiscium sp.]